MRRLYTLMLQIYESFAEETPVSRMHKTYRQSRVKQLVLFAQQDLNAIDYSDDVLIGIHSALGADMASLKEEFSHKPGFGFCAFQAKDMTIHTVDSRHAERQKLSAMTADAVQRGVAARRKACW